MSRKLVFAALFTALMIVGAYIRIPVGPVPIIFSNLFVLLAGLLLGSKWGLISTGMYLLLGGIGLPVFSAGGGFPLFLGPTGGYLLGYAGAAFITGLIAEKGKDAPGTYIFALISGSLLIYLIGVPFLKENLSLSWEAAFAAGLFPFLPGDGIKIAIAYSVFSVLRKSYPELIYSRKRE